MSVQIASVNTAAFVVGTSGAVSWEHTAPPPTIRQQMRPGTDLSGPTVVVFNESACQFLISLPLTGQTFSLPAGRWVSLRVPPNEISLSYRVTAVASNGNPLFNNLLVDFYSPGEPVDEIGTLGNSPIGATTTNLTTQLTTVDGQYLYFVQRVSGTGHAGENYDVVQLWPSASVATVNQGGALMANDNSGGGHTAVAWDDLGYVSIPVGFAGIAGVATAGQYGVPVVASATTRQLVSATGATTVLSITPTNTGLYRVSAFVDIRNGTSGNNVSLQVTYYDPDKPGGSSDFTYFVGFVGTPAFTVMNGGSAFNNNGWCTFPITIMHTGGKTLTVTYNDPTNTPNDHVSVVVEALA